MLLDCQGEEFRDRKQDESVFALTEVQVTGAGDTAVWRKLRKIGYSGPECYTEEAGERPSESENLSHLC